MWQCQLRPFSDFCLVLLLRGRALDGVPDQLGDRVGDHHHQSTMFTTATVTNQQKLLLLVDGGRQPEEVVQRGSSLLLLLSAFRTGGGGIGRRALCRDQFEHLGQ
jgi:hypothetical protein